MSQCIWTSNYIAAQLEHFCAKLLGNCKEFDPECFSWTTSRYLLGRHINIFGILLVTATVKSLIQNIFLALLHRIFTRSAHKHIWYTFSNVCKNLTALGVKKCISEHRIFNWSPISLHPLLNTLWHLYNTPGHRRNTLLALIWHNKQSTFKIRQALEYRQWLWGRVFVQLLH